MAVDQLFLASILSVCYCSKNREQVTQRVVGNSLKKALKKQKKPKAASSQSLKSDLKLEVKILLTSVVGAEVLDSVAANIGIDSLMGIELLREINSAFHCKVDLPELLAATTVGHIVTLVASALPQGAVELPDDDDDNEDDEDQLSESSQNDSLTPTSASEVDTAASEADSSPAKDIHSEEQKTRHVKAREGEGERYVVEYTAGWTPAQPLYTTEPVTDSYDAVVIVTGATGSLGAHVVAALASHPSVKAVVWINRRRPTPAETRQDNAFSTRGIALTSEVRSKLRILATDSSQLRLGLETSEYRFVNERGVEFS